VNSINEPIKYAAFGKRLVAWFADALIVAIFIFLARLIFFSLCAQIHIQLAGGKVTMISLGIGIAIAILYHVLLESSKLQATPGKMIFGLVVTDTHGKRVNKQKALARHLSKYASAVTFGIGYLLYFASKQRQCLHDKMAGCLILQKSL